MTDQIELSLRNRHEVRWDVRSGALSAWGTALSPRKALKDALRALKCIEGVHVDRRFTLLEVTDD